jgi:hypothetical protein
VLGAEGFMFGYPLVLMDLTRANSAAMLGPPNQLKRVRAFPDAGFREVVRPNVDTLYTSAFIDMAHGPFVFELPAQAQRYELMPFMDGWTHVFAAPGTRTLGAAGGRFLLAGPHWTGTVPDGLQLLRAPTRMVWLIGRTQTNGAARLRHRAPAAGQRPAAYAGRLAGRYRPAAPRLDAGGHAAGAAAAADAGAGCGRLLHPSGDADGRQPAGTGRCADAGQAGAHRRGTGPAAAMGAARPRGREPGPLDRRTPRAARAGAAARSSQRLVDAAGAAGRLRHALQPARGGGDVGLGANLPADATYPNARVDGEGQPLHGSQRYRIHFAPGQLPPVRAFWSLTAYGADDFLIANPLNRHALGDRDPLVFNADGSLDLWVQAEPPAAGRRANWLPVKAGEPFLLNARLYWPEAAALDGRWHMPPVQREP